MDSAAQDQLGPDFHQRDEDNIDASREPAATTTVRGWIDSDEWYPVYSLVTDREPYFEGDRIVDVPVETVERYERIMADFDAMQNELRELQ